jgi:hypothetical protein
MDPGTRATDTTRREFLALAAQGLALALPPAADADAPDSRPADRFEPVAIPAWVRGVTRMAFATPGDVDRAARAGAQVIHGNAVWPYFPLRRDGGGLRPEDDRRLRKFVEDCQVCGARLVLGLPPFPPVELVKQHPDWRIHPDDTGAVLKLVPEEDKLGTRLGCNLGPWGDHLIDVCVELVHDFQVDGFSFDGNYHPALCYCPACKAAYRKDRSRALPARVNLEDVAYREYLVWRGERLEGHYRRMQQRLKDANPDAVLISWTVNAGRYGHLLTSPRAMPTRLNLLFDLPMQELWLDETNLGGSVAPACGAAYLRGTTGGRPCASEAYLMARGNPYGTDSFPAHERRTRNLLALAAGNVTAESFGWPGHEDSTEAVFRQVRERERWLTRATSLPWAGLLVSEQTRQFYAYQDIPERFLPHVFGAFRCALEEHLPLTLLNDWDLDAAALAPYAVLVLANAGALSDAQAAAVRAYVRAGGGLVATAETSLADELGRPRRDFALADLFGVSYEGRPRAAQKRPELDPNFAVAIDEAYWKQRTGVATLTWSDHALVRDARLRQLVPWRSVTFRGPLVRVSRPREADAVGVWMAPEGGEAPLPAMVSRTFGQGRVVYCAAALDAALWGYAYPYQRRLLARALEWAARAPAPVAVKAPMCVQATYFVQSDKDGKRIVVHLFNGLNTTAGHGLPAMDVPLREEAVPVGGIEVRFAGQAPRSFHIEPGNRTPGVRQEEGATVVEVPAVEVHALLVGEYGGGAGTPGGGS